VIELFSPPLLDAGPEQSAQGAPGGVLDMNAVIEPTSTFGFGKVVRNRDKGNATLSVDVPNAGALVVAGKGVKRAPRPPPRPGS
jgi:hypothetical protein